MIGGRISFILIASLCIISMEIKAKEKETGRKLRAHLLSSELNCNREQVAYFGLAPGETQRILINSTVLVKALFMDSRIDNEETKRTVYNVGNFSICGFLRNRLISKLYSFIYEELVGNSTVFKCPVKPGIYYLRNRMGSQTVPGFHPAGTFRLTVRLKPERKEPFILEFIWRYRVTRT